MNFSIHDRPKFLDKLKSEKFDLLIIGGGITGAGIALDAASRGLKTALLEKNDFAFGTSSRSTKLIHGGLRYLKQLEFGLVREVGSERAVVHKLAPHLVVPEKMLLPLYEKRGFGSTLTSFGLKLYDWLAGVRPEDQRRMLTRRQTLRQEPLLREHDIKGGAIYAEYRTDDARLTLEIMKTAFRHGALAVSYCEVTGFSNQDGKVIGVKAFDHQTSNIFEVNASVIVNASGPWVDELREADHSRHGKRLHLTKGVHIVVPRDKLMVQQAVYFDVDDGRMIFAIPRARTTYIGTTDTSYSGSKNEVVASREDVEYLLGAVNRTFHISPLGFSDVESSWAGLRPLIHEDGKSTSELSRKDEIFESPSGLISIAGGKLTGYRKMAERVVNLVIERSFDQLDLKSCYTRKISLTESAFSSDKDVRKFVGSVSTEVRRLGGEQTIASYLVHTYGKQTGEILENLKNNFQTDIHHSLIHAELHFAINKEMVLCPLDFLVRRTGMLFFDIGRMKQNKELVIAEFKKLFDWNEDKVQVERKRIEDSINLSSQFL